MSCTSPVEARIIDNLRKKDELKKQLRSQYNSHGISQKQFQKSPSVFDLSSLKFALEFCEEEAFAQEEQCGLLEKTKSYSSLQQDNQVSHEHKSPFELENESLISNLRHDITRDISKMNKLFEEEKQTLLFQKQREFEEHKKMTVASTEQRLEKLKAARKLKKKKELDRIQQYFIESEQTFKKLEEQQKREKEENIVKFKNREEEAKRRQQLKLQQGKDRMAKGRQIKFECEESMEKLTLHLQNERFSCFSVHPSIVESIERSKQLITTINTATDEGLDVMNDDILQHLQQCQIDIHENIINCKKELDHLREIKDAEEAENLRKMEELKKQEAKELQEKREKELKEKNPEASLPPVPTELTTCVSKGAYQTYKNLQQVFDEYKTKSDQVVSVKTDKIKSTTSGVRRIISRAFSSISDRAGSDLKNCLEDLHSLLKGENIKLGTKTVNVGSIDNGLVFAQNQLAKSFVSRCEDMVSSSHKEAFPLAFTILGVWCEDTRFGEVFLAQLQAKCPYVVPMYVPYKEGQSAIDYKKSLGYKVDASDKIEDEELYLKRMSGMVRTYAAIIQSSLKPGYNKHPHGIEHGWIWLSRLVNMKPREGLTPAIFTVLYDFLDVAGHAMHASYGNQFIKMLNVIQKHFVPEMEKLSDGLHQGPISRLKRFLESILKSGVKKPVGHLEKSFWSSYHDTDVVGG